jgi:membrane protein YdbS with pleckstrin-like domain/phage FluMu protein Com
VPDPAETRRPAAIDRYLLPQERHEIIAVRQHPAVLLGPSALAIAGLLVAGVLSATILHGNRVLVDIVWLAWLVLLLRLVWKAINWGVTFFVITSQRMLLASGVLTRKVAMMPLTRVTDMSFKRSFAGRMLGYGEFIVESAGQDQALRNVPYIPYPEALYLQVCGMLFPGPPCPVCKGTGKIYVWEEEQEEVDEFGETSGYPLSYGQPPLRRGRRWRRQRRSATGRAQRRVPEEYQVAGEAEQSREALLEMGYIEIICPRCDGEGTVPPESANVASAGDGT